MRLSVGLNVASGRLWLKAWFAATAPYVDEIIVAPGAAEDWVRLGNAHSDGTSLDGTEEELWRWKTILGSKVAILPPRVYPTRNAQLQAILGHVSGDVLMRLDADEFYRPEAFGVVRQLFDSDKRLLMLGMPFRMYFTWHRYWNDVYTERAVRMVPGLSYPVEHKGGQWLLLDGRKLWKDARPAPAQCTVHHFGRIQDPEPLRARMDYYFKRDGGTLSDRDIMALEKRGGEWAADDELPPAVRLLPRALIGPAAARADSEA